MSIRDCLVLVEGAEESWDSASGAFWCDRHVLTCKHSLTTDGKPTGELVDKQKIRVIHPDNPSKQLKVLQILADENPDLDAVLLEVDGGPSLQETSSLRTFHGESVDGFGYPESLIPDEEVEYRSSEEMGRLRLYAEGSVSQGENESNLVVKGIGDPGSLKKLARSLSGFSGTLLFDSGGRAVGLVKSLVGEGYSQIRALTMHGLEPLFKLLPNSWKEWVERNLEKRGSGFLASLGEPARELVLRMGSLTVDAYLQSFFALQDRSNASMEDLLDLFWLTAPRTVPRRERDDGYVPAKNKLELEIIVASQSGWGCICQDGSFPLVLSPSTVGIGADGKNVIPILSRELACMLDIIDEDEDPDPEECMDDECLERISSSLEYRSDEIQFDFALPTRPGISLLVCTKDKGARKVIHEQCEAIMRCFGVSQVFVSSPGKDRALVNSLTKLSNLHKRLLKSQRRPDQQKG